MNCSQLEDGQCRIAGQLAEMPCPADTYTCTRCAADRPPQDINKTTVELAVATIRKSGDLRAAGRLARDYVHLFPRQETGRQESPETEGGPGSELARLLKRFGIEETETCNCRSRAAKMDREGCDWCEQHLDTIVGWLREEAQKQELRFNGFAARQLVKLAIRRARKKECIQVQSPKRESRRRKVRSAASQRASVQRAISNQVSRAAIRDRRGIPTPLEGVYRGGCAFLIGSGPSLAETDLTPLNRFGILTLGVNNSPSLFRPNLWCAMDPARNFVQQIWRDPAIMKFVPWHRRRERTRRFSATGTLVNDEHLVDYPNIWFYEREQNDFDPARFLTSDKFHWGCSEGHRDPDGRGGGRSVMFVALKLLYHLGCRYVFLVGCDFHMEPEAPYAFPQTKTPGECRANNGLYATLCRRLEMLAPHFDAAGYRVVSVTPESRLNRVLPHWTLDRAIDLAVDRVGKTVVTKDMYR